MIKTSRSGCKINWYLKVTGKRENGYHDIVTLFQYLDSPSDTIEFDFAAAPGIKVSCDNPSLPQDLDNLAGKAARAYALAAGLAPCWRIFIKKDIPSAAGLGGGSAGAGGILSLLNGIYNAFTPQELTDIAFSLGADIPFFLNRRAAWVTGAGEFFEEISDVPEIPEILIVNPGFPVSAKWAYTHMAEERKTPDDERFKAEFLSGEVSSWHDFCRNDLAPALYEKFPLLTIMKDHLLELGALAVQVSGSGSSLFALYEKDVLKKAELFRKRFSSVENLRLFAKGIEL